MAIVSGLTVHSPRHISLTTRIVLQLDSDALASVLRECIVRLTADGSLAPLYAILDGVLKNGTLSQRSAIAPADLLPMFTSPRAEIRETALELISRLAA